MQDTCVLCQKPLIHQPNGSTLQCCTVRTPEGIGVSVYYHAGNIFVPDRIHGSDAGRTRGAIIRFVKKFKMEMIEDMAAEGYKSLGQLAGEQLPDVDN